MKKTAILVAAVGFCLINSAAVFAACPSADLNGDCVVDVNDFAIMASQWLVESHPDPDGMVFVSINDPGVSGHEGFDGEMSK